MIPPLDVRGLLPPGCHPSPLEHIPPIFCTNDHRWHLWDSALAGLDVLCDTVKQQPAPAPTLILGGSFFSDKALPNDIEATLLFPKETLPETCWFWAGQFTKIHAILKQVHRLDFYPSLPGQNDFCLYFQYVGPKTAAIKGLGEKALRGVIEVLNW